MPRSFSLGFGRVERIDITVELKGVTVTVAVTEYVVRKETVQI